MKVLIVDTSIHLGHPLLSFDPPRTQASVSYFDEAPYVRPLGTSLPHKMLYHVLGRRPATAWILNTRLLEVASEYRPAVVIVVKGAYIFPKTLRRLRAFGARLVNYATDDPFNRTNADGWLRSAIREYDLYACTKRAIEGDVRSAGCNRTAFVRFGYNPSLHFPEQAASDVEAKTFSSDVVFVGTADADRLPYLNAVLSIPRVRLALYGSGWDRQAERYRRLARGIVTGRRYRLALGGAKIALGLLREANRDEHTMRTFEIPACGSLLCARRSSEHNEIFRDGVEAVFFDDPGDLRSRVLHYLNEDQARSRIALAGFHTVTHASHTYSDRIVEMSSLVNA